MIAATRWPMLLAAILLVGLVLRGVTAVGVQWLLENRLHRQFLVPGDAEGYWILAQQMVRGADYRVYDPPRYVLRMPGFPAFLAAGMQLFGENPWGIRLWLAVAGTGTCGLVFWLAKTLTDVPTALWATMAAAVAPLFVAFSVLELSETLFGAGILASLIPAARYLKASGGTSLQAIACGLGVAIGTYIRPSWLLAGPLLASLIVWKARGQTRSLFHAVQLLLALMMSLAPWTVRNYLVTGHFIPTTLWMGASLYDGLHPGATGDSDMTFFDAERLPERMSEYAVDRHYRDAALKFAWANPGRVAELALVKATRYWSLWPNATGFNAWWTQIICAAWSLPVFLFAALSLRQPVRQQFPWVAPLCWGPVLYFALLHMLFAGSLRYRLPAEYPLLIAAAVGARYGSKRVPKV